MNVSLSWLKDMVALGLSHEALAAKMTDHSQEVEHIRPLVAADRLVIGKIASLVQHPDADNLTVCRVDVGKETLDIVCGAPNAKAGQTVIVAREGATLAGGLRIEKTNIRGVVSEGMICSLSELGIDEKYHHEKGIHVIEENLPPGRDALKALHLDDTVMALDLTPNRADLLSMHGVAYDVAAILDVPLNIKALDIDETPAQRPLDISTTTGSCRSYFGLIIENMRVKESPRWMRARLIAAGIRPINNIVDITNYVMLETGQPLHAFDADKMQSDTILVREAREAERFVTLDDKERQLEAGDILITDGDKAVALGGVMGGRDTEVSDKTVRILLEAAVFDPVQVRKTSHRLGLRSESSLRFERGVDPEKTKFALFRAAELFIAHASGRVKDGYSGFDNHQALEKTLTLTAADVNDVLGSNYTLEHISAVLKRLRFEHAVVEGRLEMVCPTRRVDIVGLQDVIEEIGRLSGYNELPSTLPKTVSTGALSPLQKRRRKTRAVLTGLGFDEVVGYALTDKASVNTFTRNADSAPLELANPMSEARAVMRLSAAKTLLEIIAYNVARQTEDAAIFELGKTYAASGEKEVLALAIHGTYRDGGWLKGMKTDFYTLKAVFEALCSALCIDGVAYAPKSLEGYHPHQCASIEHDGKTIGHIGKVHPKEAQRLDLGDVYVLEVDFLALHDVAKEDIDYDVVSRYPSVERDLALVVDENVPAASLHASLKTELGDVLKAVHVFDVYSGKGLPDGKKSLGFRLVFSSTEKTWTHEDIERFIARVLKTLERDHDARLR